MMQIKLSSAVQHFMFLMVDSSDHVTGKTGLTPTVTISKNAGAFASPSGAITEVSGGWYKLAANATDSNTLGVLALHATATGADPTDMILGCVVAYDPQDTVRLGLTAMPNVASGSAGAIITSGTGTAQLSVSAGAAAVQSGYKRNTAITAFPFVMTDSTNHNPTAGFTVTVQRRLAGGSFTTVAATPVDAGNGWYTVDLSTADMNSPVIAFKCTASGADDTDFTIATDP